MFYFKLVKSVLIFFTFFFGISQNAVLSTGSDFKNEFGSFSYSVGQILISQNSSTLNSFTDPIILSHGVQQVFLQSCNEANLVEIIATPNPSNGNIQINLKNWDEEDIELNIYNTLGRNVFNDIISQDQIRLDLSYLSSGMYIISLGYHCGGLRSFKLLINNK